MQNTKDSASFPGALKIDLSWKVQAELVKKTTIPLFCSHFGQPERHSSFWPMLFELNVGFSLFFFFRWPFFAALIHSWPVVGEMCVPKWRGSQ